MQAVTMLGKLAMPEEWEEEEERRRWGMEEDGKVEEREPFGDG